jgi:hypothetical protein
MIPWLTLATCLAAVLLLVVIAVNLWRIIKQLESIGGTPISWLGKVRFGLRAIESETAQIAPQVTILNSSLAAVDNGLRQVERDLASTVPGLRKGQS